MDERENIAVTRDRRSGATQGSESLVVENGILGRDIQAKAEASSVAPTPPSDPTVPDLLMLMLQSLLEDQFQLKAHRETKELPVYELVVSKGGLKFKLSEDQTFPPPPERGAPNLESLESTLCVNNWTSHGQASFAECG